MATITFAGGILNTTAGNKTTTALTVASNDLIVLVCWNTGRTTAQPPVPTDDNGGAAYTQHATAATKNTSADSMWIFVRNSLLSSASATTFSFTQASDSGGGMGVYRIAGMSKTGSAAIRQVGKADNQATGTPSVSMGVAIDTNNPVIGSVFTGQTGTTNTAPPTGWTEDADSGYNTPATGRELVHIDSGSTLSTVAWTAATTSAFCAIVVELDASAAASTYPGWWGSGGGTGGTW